MQTESDSVRINKFIAQATGLSRREADERVEHGRVTIDGIKAEPGSRVQPNSTVLLDGKKVTAAHTFHYLLLSKPVQYLSSRKSQGGVPTIYDLLPDKYRALKPVGRLDKNTSGLLLLTDDGDFAHRMTHPSFHKVKIYEAELDTPLAALHQQMISDFGIQLEDGPSTFLVEKIPRHEAHSRALGGVGEVGESFHDEPEGQAPLYKVREGHEAHSRALGGVGEVGDSFHDEPEGQAPLYRITMHEGRNRQIRRTFAALGYEVTKLHRVSFGPYSLDDMKKGEYRLTEKR